VIYYVPLEGETVAGCIRLLCLGWGLEGCRSTMISP